MVRASWMVGAVSMVAAGALLGAPAQGLAIDTKVRVAGLEVEHAREPLGIDVRQPRLSWKLASQRRGERQTGYRILVASEPSRLSPGRADVWDSGEVESRRSTGIAYGGPQLESSMRYFWTVRVRDRDGRASAWSRPASWEMGLLEPSDWTAEWIGAPKPVKPTLDGARWIWFPEQPPAPALPAMERYFRTTVTLPADRALSRARLVISADDRYVLYVNGERLAEPPAGGTWQQAQIVDVTAALQPGQNTIAVKAVNALDPQGALTPAGLIARLVAELETGAPVVAASGPDWLAADAEEPGWQEPGFDDSAWRAAREIAAYGGGPWGGGVTIPPDPGSALGVEGVPWIWHAADGSGNAPVGTRLFRRTIHLPHDRDIARARFALTADDELELYVNGRLVATHAPWTFFASADLTGVLRPGENVLAVAATNAEPSPAGLIGRLRVEFEDAGAPLEIDTGSEWLTAAAAPDGWQHAGFDDSGWAAAREIATYGNGPWGRTSAPEHSTAASHLRKAFSLGKRPVRARLYATALGLYEMRINGRRVGDQHFTPGWTDYDRRVQYQAYDVTKLMRKGRNAVGAILANGWYAGHVAIFGSRQYGDTPLLRAQLRLEFADGTSETVATDGSWRRSADGPLRSTDIIMGEIQDRRLAMPGWDRPGFAATGWSPATVADGVTAALVAPPGEPVRVTEHVRPVAVTEPRPGTFVFDLGQNLVGWAAVRARGPSGTHVRVRHAEVLNPDGTIYTENLRDARATEDYILAGDGNEVLEPHFAFHGFRYVEVTGYPGRPSLDAVTARVAGDDARPAGRLITSSDMVNRLERAVAWTARGKFLSVPGDVPRDERLGWTGDMNLFAGTAASVLDMRRVLDKWLGDLRDGQSPDGAFPDVAPVVGFFRGGGGNAGWADAGVTVPWTLWQRYGDTRVIEQNYDAMARYIRYLEAHSSGLLRPATGYGDWLNVDAETPKDVIATAWFARSASLMADMARAIGRDDDADRYERLAGEVKSAFTHAYVDAQGRVHGDTQTAYVLALAFDLVPAGLRVAAADRLVALIHARDDHLSTGFLGTEPVLRVLADTGHLDLAHRILQQETFPSWGYMLRNGATTIWEHWGSIGVDGSFHDPEMNSFNLAPFASVGDWLYRYVGGIEVDPAAPGYRRVIVRPRPGPDLRHARARLATPYGPVTTNWRLQESTFRLRVTVPANAEALVHVPASGPTAVTEGQRPPDRSPMVRFLRMEDGHAVFAVGSGTYDFRSTPED